MNRREKVIGGLDEINKERLREGQRRLKEQKAESENIEKKVRRVAEIMERLGIEQELVEIRDTLWGAGSVYLINTGAILRAEWYEFQPGYDHYEFERHSCAPARCEKRQWEELEVRTAIVEDSNKKGQQKPGDVMISVISSANGEAGYNETDVGGVTIREGEEITDETKKGVDKLLTDACVLITPRLPIIKTIQESRRIIIEAIQRGELRRENTVPSDFDSQFPPRLVVAPEPIKRKASFFGLKL